jgi:4'-phosphopantetheinyl transferase
MPDAARRSINQPAASLRFLDRARQGLDACGLSPCGAGEVSIVCFDSAAWGAWETEAIELLDDQERQRAARFRFARDRCAYVFAHAVWRVVLGVTLEANPGEVPLHFLPTGQPQLRGTRLATSLSHSGAWVLIAVGGTGALGVDVERWPPRVPMEALLPLICTPGEGDAVHALPVGQRERKLLQLWTRKEAFLKALGTGLGQPPASFGAPPGAIVVPPDGLSGVPCRVIDLALPAGLVGAMAVPLEVSRYRIHALALSVRVGRTASVKVANSA